MAYNERRQNHRVDYWDRRRNGWEVTLPLFFFSLHAFPLGTLRWTHRPRCILYPPQPSASTNSLTDSWPHLQCIEKRRRRSFNSNRVFGPTRYWILRDHLAASRHVEMPPNRRGAMREWAAWPDLTFKTLSVTVTVLLFVPALLSCDARHNEPTLFSYFGARETDVAWRGAARGSVNEYVPIVMYIFDAWKIHKRRGCDYAFYATSVWKWCFPSRLISMVRWLAHFAPIYSNDQSNG